MAITSRPQPTLRTGESCTGHERITYSDPELGTLTFGGDDDCDDGVGRVEILSHDPTGGLEVAYTITASEWRRVVAFVDASLPSRRPIARLRRWIRENR